MRQQLGRNDLASGADPAHSPASLPHRPIQQEPQQAGKDRQDSHFILCDPLAQPGRIALLAGLGQDQLGADGQRREDDRERGIKEVRNNQEQAIVRPDIQDMSMPLDRIDNGSVLDHHAPGPAHAAGGVNHISQIVSSWLEFRL